MILAIYDMSGIQKFIFATNKIREIIGASIIVHDALYENIPELFDEKNWQENNTFSSDKSGIVYIGGGNALVLYETEEEYQEKTTTLLENVFLQSGGAIRVFSAFIELDEKKSFSENQKDLMSELDKRKKSGGTSVPVALLPIMAYDNNNFEPQILADENTYSSMSRYLKKQKKSDNKGCFFDDLAPKGCSFKNDFEDSRDLDQKNYQAIIHIDGNTMGIKIREAVSELKGNLLEQLNGMKKLSIEISNVYKSALKEAIDKTFENESGPIDFRPIIMDGDDITVMIKSEKAFRFVENFMTKLSEKKFETIKNFNPTAAAGIAFVKLKYPFSIAYEIAEECCHNAKKTTIKRCGGSENFNKSPMSSVDWQICFSNISDEISAYSRLFILRSESQRFKRAVIEKCQRRCRDPRNCMGGHFQIAFCNDTRQNKPRKRRRIHKGPFRICRRGKGRGIKNRF